MLRNNKLWYIFIIALLLNGCEKKVNSPDLSQPEVIISKDSALSEENIPEIFINENQAEETVVVTDILQKSEEFLTDFFQNKDYVLLDEPLDVIYRKIYFAVHYIMAKPEIFDMAVGFEIMDGSVIPCFYIKDFKFFDKSNITFIDFSEGYDRIFGFNFMYSYPKQPSPYMPGLVMRTYFDNGKRVADTFDLDWNEEIMTFEKFKKL